MFYSVYFQQGLISFNKKGQSNVHQVHCRLVSNMYAVRPTLNDLQVLML